MFLAWFAWSGVVASWSGNRLLRPTPATGQVIPYNDHGIFFVTLRDLITSDSILVVGVVLGLLSAACYLADAKPWRRRAPD
jgi:hypothetical protein